MGMDAKANVFYGYKVSFDAVDDEGDYKPMPHGITIVRQCGYFHMAIAETNQLFDWDYGVQSLKLDSIQKSDVAEWNKLLKQCCETVDLKFKKENCGWFVVCDFR